MSQVSGVACWGPLVLSQHLPISLRLGQDQESILWLNLTHYVFGA